MKKELQDLLDKHKEILEKDKQIIPALFAEIEDKQYAVILLPQFPVGTAKEDMLEGAGKMMKQQKLNIRSITMVADFWIKKIKPEELANIKNMLPISKQKGKQQAITIAYWDLLADEKIAVSQIYKMEKDKIVWDKPIETTGAENLQFNLLGYFWQGFMSDLSQVKGGETSG